MALENKFRMKLYVKDALNKFIPTVTANDNTVFEFEVFDGADRVELLDTYHYIFVTKAIGKDSVQRDAVLNAEGLVEVVLGYSETKHPGTIDCALQIYDENNKRISTMRMKVNVTGDMAIMGGLPAEDSTLVIADEAQLTRAVSAADEVEVSKTTFNTLSERLEHDKTELLKGLDEVNLELTERVKTINGVTPDGNGNVIVDVPKVDTSVLATKSELVVINNAKASKDELNALGQLKLNGTYDNLEALQVANPTGAAGLYLVIADGYTYRWNGTSWVRAVQFQSTGIAEASISPEKLDFTRTFNLFNYLEATTGRLRLAESQNMTNINTGDSGYFTSSIYNVTPGDIYSIQTPGTQTYPNTGIGFFSSDGVFVSFVRIPDWQTKLENITVPVGATRMRFTSRKTDQSSKNWESVTMLVKAESIPTTFIPYGAFQFTDHLRFSSSQVNTLKIDLGLDKNGTVFFVPANFNWSSDLSAYANKTFAISSHFVLTGKTVNLPSGCTLDFSHGGSFKDGSFISPSQTATGTDVIKLIVPEGKSSVILGCSFNSGYFRSVNRFYISSLTGTVQNDIQNVYGTHTYKLLQRFVYSTVVFDTPYRNASDDGVTYDFAEGLTLTTSGMGKIGLGNVRWRLMDNCKIEKADVDSYSGSFWTLAGKNIEIKDNVFRKVHFRVINNSTTWLFSGNNFPSVQNYQTALAIEGSNGIVDRNTFYVESDFHHGKAITLIQGSNSNVITNNRITGGITGIILSGADLSVTAKGVTKNNIIEGNIIRGIKEEAISLDPYLGSSQVSKDRFVVENYVSANTVDVSLFTGASVETAVKYISYITFGIDESVAGKYSEITGVEQNGSFIRITTDRNIFTTEMIGKRFGICFGLVGNIIKDNTVYESPIDLHGNCFGNIIKDNKSYTASYMAIYAVGGNPNYVYGNAYFAPMVDNVIEDNIVPYGGILIGTKVLRDGENGNVDSSITSKFACLRTKVRGNVVGMYVDVYGHYFSDCEAGGREVYNNVDVIKTTNLNNLHLFKFSSYKDTNDKNNLIKNNGQRILFLDSDDKLYLYNGDKDGTTFVWKALT